MKQVLLLIFALVFFIASCNKNDQITVEKDTLLCLKSSYNIDSHVEKLFARLDGLEKNLRKNKWDSITDNLDKIKKDLSYFEDEISASGGSLRMDISMRIISIMKGDLNKRNYYETRTRFEYLQSSILKTLDFLETEIPYSFYMLTCQFVEMNDLFKTDRNWQAIQEEYDEVLKLWVMVNSNYLENTEGVKKDLLSEDIKTFIDEISKMGVYIQKNDLDSCRGAYGNIIKSFNDIIEIYAEAVDEEVEPVNG